MKNSDKRSLQETFSQLWSEKKKLEEEEKDRINVRVVLKIKIIVGVRVYVYDCATCISWGHIMNLGKGLWIEMCLLSFFLALNTFIMSVLINS